MPQDGASIAFSDRETSRRRSSALRRDSGISEIADIVRLRSAGDLSLIEICPKFSMPTQ